MRYVVEFIEWYDIITHGNIIMLFKNTMTYK